MFYIQFKDQWVDHQFSYLEEDAERARLEGTRPGNKKKFVNRRSPLVICEELQTLSQIMTKELISMNHDDDILHAYRKMENEQIHHLLVFKKRKFLGLLSFTDLLPYKKIKYAGMATIETILNTVILAAHETTTLGQAALVLKNERISSMIILNDDKEICGIVTVNDFLEKITEVFP